MFEAVLQMFSYPFMVRAFAVGIPVGVCAALLGVSLCLGNLSMIGDGLSHVAFGAMAVALVMNAAPVEVAIPVVIVAAFLLCHARGKGRGDAAIAVVSCGALALGVMAISLSPGTNVDLNTYLFGSILAIDRSDALLSLVLSGVVLVLYVLFYNRIFAVTFDENFARASGARAELHTFLISALTAVIVVLGMRLMGAMLISGLLIIPAVCAMRVCRSFKGVVAVSAGVAALSVSGGVVSSYALSTPAGSSIVCAGLVLLGIFWLAGLISRRIRK